MPVPDAALQSLAERVRPVELRSEQPPFPVVPGLATLLPNGLTRGTTVSVGAAPGIGGALTLALALAAAPSRSGAWMALVDPPPSSSPGPSSRGGPSAQRALASGRPSSPHGPSASSASGGSDRGASGSGGGRAGASVPGSVRSSRSDRGPGGGGSDPGSSGPGERAGADPGRGSGLPVPPSASAGRGPVVRRSVRGGAVSPPGPVAGEGSSRRSPGGRAPAPPSGPAEVAWGLVAASGLGVALERVVVVAPETPPASGWGPVLAALVDGFPIVVVGPRVQLRAGDGRRLAARLRERGGVLIRVGDASATSSAHVRLRIVEGEWEGVDEGAGYLRSRRVVVEAGGRGAASRPRRAELLLPGPTGEVTLAPPTPLHLPTPVPAQPPEPEATPRPAAPASPVARRSEPDVAPHPAAPAPPAARGSGPEVAPRPAEPSPAPLVARAPGREAGAHSAVPVPVPASASLVGGASSASSSPSSRVARAPGREAGAHSAVPVPASVPVVGGASSGSRQGRTVAGAPGDEAPVRPSSGSVPGRPLRPAVSTEEPSGGPVRRHSRSRRHRRRSSVPASQGSDASPVGGGRMGAGV